MPAIQTIVLTRQIPLIESYVAHDGFTSCIANFVVIYVIMPPFIL
jgi:hypothetical protein